MSTSSIQTPSERFFREVPPSEMEAIADHLVALVEEFEAALSEGHVPPAFKERLAELRQIAELLI